MYNASDPKCPPADEAQMMRGLYERLLLPKMAPHQKLAVVPGLFGDYSKPLGAQDDDLLAKIDGYVAWAQREPRIALVNAWHYADLGAPPNTKVVPNHNHQRDGPYVRGAYAFPKLLARLRALGDAINASQSRTD